MRLMVRKNLFLLPFFLPFLLCILQAQEKGKASYYAKELHGRRMASGMTYHRDSLTCAHPFLPFGTKLRVKNLANGKEVVVSVQDRGPYVRGRIIDLSQSAAAQLGMIGHGVVAVEVSIYRDPGIKVPFAAIDSLPVVDFKEAACIENEVDEELLPARKLRRLITQQPARSSRREKELFFSEEFLQEMEEGRAGADEDNQ